ncbi:MAG: hydrogenase nickel incorporation protein HypB [Candidatus Neomarinimicrobiota bacterium]
MEIKIVRNVLEANDKLAAEIRQRTAESQTLLVNLMSSPGSGKTTLLEKLIPILQNTGHKVGVIEGDITTTMDAERLQPLNIPVVQINTEPFGGDCHLGAEVILPALESLNLSQLDLVFIENVGNLVCPAEFDTGADFNVVVISVTEGEDKPLKYPLMFRVCQLALISKTDLLPHLGLNVNLLRQNILKINPKIGIIPISSNSGEGLSAIADWLSIRLKRAQIQNIAR